MRLIDFKDNFPNEAACKAEFKLLREKSGIVCKKCKGKSHYWLTSKEMYQCKNNSCRFRTSLKSGTVMENSKMSYFNWFLMTHLICSTKNDFSALELQRQIGHKYYAPVFFMAHKLRLVMGKRDSIYTFEGSVEMDEGYFTHSNPLEVNEFTGVKEELKRGVGSQKKSKVLVMNSIIKVKPSIEKSKHKHNTIPKYLKMTVIENVKSKDLIKEITEKISEESELITDHNRAYSDLNSLVKTHTVNNVTKVDACKVLPWVHKAISNAKGKISNVYKGVSEQYLQNYLNEHSYKFNRRNFEGGIFSRLISACVLYTWY